MYSGIPPNGMPGALYPSYPPAHNNSGGPAQQHHQYHHQQQHQQQHQQHQPTGASTSQLSAEQYHLMMLQYQLQQSQAQAQAQAQLLSMYQQQQQQQSLMSATAAYHQALSQYARTQAPQYYGSQAQQPAGYGSQPPAPTPNAGGQMPSMGSYGAYGTPGTYGTPGGLPSDGAVPSLAQLQQQLGSYQGNANVMPVNPSAAYGAGTTAAMAGQLPPNEGEVPGPGSNPNSTAKAPPSASADTGAEARIHATLADTVVEWVPLPPRYVMDSVAKTAAATKMTKLRRKKREDQVTADDSTPPSEVTEPTTPSTKTVFVGGISFDVARDPRVLPWLAASMCSKPVVIRKVIPHKERRSKQDHHSTNAHSEGESNLPKLALSAFAVVDAEDAQILTESLHHRVLWDIGGCWVAKSPEATEVLRDYCNAHCTWQRREAGAAAGLPRHMMTVESATAVGSHEKLQQQAAKHRGDNITAKINFGQTNDSRTSQANTPPPASTESTTPALLPAGISQQPIAPLVNPQTRPSHADEPELRIDWGFLPQSLPAGGSGSGHSAHDVVRAASSNSSSSSRRSGTIGDNRAAEPTPNHTGATQ